MISPLAAAASGFAALGLVLTAAFLVLRIRQVVLAVALACAACAPFVVAALHRFERSGLDAAAPASWQVPASAFILYAFLALLFVQAFFAATMSITVSLLTGLGNAGKTSLREEDAVRALRLEELVVSRLEAMVAAGLLTASGSGADRVYRPNWRCLLYGRVFGAFKRRLGLGAGG